MSNKRLPARSVRQNAERQWEKWRRRESNPRSQQSATDSEENPDLASADAGETASEPRHKHGSDSSPVICPGQLSMFDLLDGAGDDLAAVAQPHDRRHQPPRAP
jgi:hypothetical protein